MCVMDSIRIIGRLDIKGPNLVKGVHLEGLRVLGDPKPFATAYYQEGIDELIYMDTVASLYGRNSLDQFVGRTASSIFVPLAVGGGIRTHEDADRLLRAGADKVVINTAAIKRPGFITSLARRFGSSCVVVSIEAKSSNNSSYECFTDNGRERTGVDVLEWAVRAEHLGAGELILTSVDYEGTGRGYDLELTRQVADAVDIPVVASGGCGKVDHVSKAILAGHADAVAVASIFHYGQIERQIDLENGGHTGEGNFTFVTRIKYR